MEHTVYLITAIVGGTILVAQVVLQVFGLAGDTDGGMGDGSHDFDHGDAGADGHHDGHGHGNWFFGFLSFKALVAFAGIFGLTGLTLLNTDLSFGWRLSIAIEAGILGMVLVAFLMRSLSRLTVSGTVNVRNAVGRTGGVYLRIPGGGQGEGKVTVEIQGRSLQLNAVTDGPSIPTGSRVTVVEVVGDETLKVIPV